MYTLAYADNIVKLVKKEKDIRSMLSRLERYIDEKKLELNKEKTRILRFFLFREGGGRRKW